MNKKQLKEALDKARIRVSELDKTDGFRDRNPGTIMAALEAGLTNPKTGAHFDAMIMLQDLTRDVCSLLRAKKANKNN